jgi:Tat protein translocase TatB subunit
VFLLILESLGSTELVFILVMALVFFGPRKLPQLSRTMGKHLAEFRRASDDFKRTWDREVSLEDLTAETPATPAIPFAESSTWDEHNVQSTQPPTIGAIPPDRVISRQANGPIESTVVPSSDEADLSLVSDSKSAMGQPEPLRKRDWL